jgi:hypothetical protein
LPALRGAGAQECRGRACRPRRGGRSPADFAGRGGAASRWCALRGACKRCRGRP